MTLSRIQTILAADSSQVRQHASLPPLPRSPKPRMSADCSGNGIEAGGCRSPPDRYLDARPLLPACACFVGPIQCDAVCAVSSLAPNALNLYLHLDLWALQLQDPASASGTPDAPLRSFHSQTQKGRDARPCCGSFRKLAAVRALGPSACPLRARRSIGRSWHLQAQSHRRFWHASARRATPSAAGETLIRSQHTAQSCYGCCSVGFVLLDPLSRE